MKCVKIVVLVCLRRVPLQWSSAAATRRQICRRLPPSSYRVQGKQIRAENHVGRSRWLALQRSSFAVPVIRGWRMLMMRTTRTQTRRCGAAARHSPRSACHYSYSWRLGSQSTHASDLRRTRDAVHAEEKISHQSASHQSDHRRQKKPTIFIVLSYESHHHTRHLCVPGWYRTSESTHAHL